MAIQDALCALHTVTVHLCLAANPVVHLWVTLAVGNG